MNYIVRGRQSRDFMTIFDIQLAATPWLCIFWKYAYSMISWLCIFQEYAYLRLTWLCIFQKYAYSGMCWLCISAKYAYFGAYAYYEFQCSSTQYDIFTSSYSAITGQKAISLILVLCTTVVLSAVPGSCIFMWIPLLENKKIHPAGLQWWPNQNKKQSSDFHLQHCLICWEGWRI